MKAHHFIATQPWAILPAMLTTILDIAARETDPEAVAAKLGRPLENTYQIEMRDGIAILPVTGAIMRYANLFSKVSGATSIELLATDFNQALHNPDVKAIVLNIDSPGGTVAGINEFAEMIYAARTQKPIVAYVSGMGASAAYWLASAADEIVIDATASVGSIGVVSVQQDDSERKAKAGVKEIQIVSSLSPRKRLDAATDTGRADVQALVDCIANVFFQTVARNRHVTTDAVLSDFGQGGLLVGSDAVKAGMADRIGSLEHLLTDLSNRTNKGKGAKKMSETVKSETPAITVEYLTQHYPTIAESLCLEGATFERERIRAVEAQSMPGHEALIQALKFDGKTTGAEAAIKVLAAEKTLRSTSLQNFRADAPAPLPMPGIQYAEKNAPEDTQDEPPIEEKHEAEWCKDKRVRAEFSNKETFLAYRKAQVNGQVRLLSRVVE